MMIDRFDLAVIGGGIVGLAHAYHGAKAGMRVVLFERNGRALGGSIRNFGMVWPIGRVTGPDLDRAMRARALWLELRQEAGVAVRECGSLHLALTEAEEVVLSEFVDSEGASRAGVEMLSAAETLGRFDLVRRDRVRAAMWSPTECAVQPADAMAGIAGYLDSLTNVDVRFDTPVAAVEGGVVRTGAGDEIAAERVIVASGPDFRTLFPAAYASMSMTACELQMMRVRVQGRLGEDMPHVAGGLTLLHYPAFAACPSIGRVREHYEDVEPRLAAFGIHVMASRGGASELIVGDSHRYGPDPDGFRDEAIDRLILNYLGLMLDAEFEVASRWMGVYSKSTSGAMFEHRAVGDGVEVVNGFGGMGMTIGLAAAEEVLAGTGVVS